MCLTDAVGDGGANAKVDVALVQVLINLNADRMPPDFQQLAEDGLIGSKTIDAIQTFQRHVLEQAAATGELDSDGPTLEALQRGVPADWSPRTSQGHHATDKRGANRQVLVDYRPAYGDPWSHRGGTAPRRGLLCT